MFKFLAAASILFFPTLAVAQCYSGNDTTFTKTDDGFLMQTSANATELYEGSAGIGADFRVLFTEDATQDYVFYYEGGNLVLDGKVYRKGCE